jgi:hypothetical protein
MKPTAPSLTLSDDAPESSLQSEIARVCETKAREERDTIPAPPSPETLRAATPCPPARVENNLDTIPAPPTSVIRKRDEDEEQDEAVASTTIPGAPRVPDVHSM